MAYQKPPSHHHRFRPGVLAMKGFMIRNCFLDGGMTGIAILLHEIFHFNISILVIALNLVFIYLGYRNIGKTIAVQRIIAVRTEIEKLPTISDQVSFKPKVSIGINTGEMISGNIGSVSLRRLDYTVIGDNVNIAQRLQSVAKENQVIITETAYELVKESFNCSKVGEVSLKNKAKSVNVYEVMY